MRDRQLTIDYKEAFGTPGGGRVLADLKKTTKATYSNPPTENNALLMAYREGQRSVYIHILNKVNRDISEPKQERAINE